MFRRRVDATGELEGLGAYQRTGIPTNIVVIPEAIRPELQLGQPTGGFTIQDVLKQYIPTGSLESNFKAFLPAAGGPLMRNLQLHMNRGQFENRRQLLSQVDGLRRRLDSASYPPNKLGLYDMHGNNWQWTDTSEPSSRGLRGGSWCNDGTACRTGLRSRHAPSTETMIAASSWFGQPNDSPPPSRSQRQRHLIAIRFLQIRTRDFVAHG